MNLGLPFEVIVANLASQISRRDAVAARCCSGAADCFLRKVKPVSRIVISCVPVRLPCRADFLPGNSVSLPGKDNCKPWRPFFLPCNDVRLPWNVVRLPCGHVFQPCIVVSLPWGHKFLPWNRNFLPWNDKFLPWMLVFKHLRGIGPPNRPDLPITPIFAKT